MSSLSDQLCLKRKLDSSNGSIHPKELKMSAQTNVEYLSPFSPFLYKNVTNTDAVRTLIFSNKLPCCLLKPKYVLSLLQLGLVIKKAMDNQKDGKMKTRAIATEILYFLSPSKNITDSLKTFGAADGDTDLLFLYNGNDFHEKIGSHVKGDEISVEQLTEFLDIPAIKQIYGITEIELSNSTLEDSVISRIASKEFFI